MSDNQQKSFPCGVYVVNDQSFGVREDSCDEYLFEMFRKIFGNTVTRLYKFEFENNLKELYQESEDDQVLAISQKRQNDQFKCLIKVKEFDTKTNKLVHLNVQEIPHETLVNIKQSTNIVDFDDFLDNPTKDHSTFNQ